MPNRIKLYAKVGGTLVKLEKLPLLLSLIPSSNDISEHFEICQNQGKYQPIEVEVSDDDFLLIIKEIRKCLGVSVGGSSIPIVFASNYYPIVVFTKSKSNGQ